MNTTICRPNIGDNITITTHDDTYTGRVIDIDDDRILIKEGAGYWNLPHDTIRTIDIAGPANATPTNENAARLVTCSQQRTHSLAQRTLDRWP